MKNFEKYKNGAPLTETDLEAVTEKLVDIQVGEEHKEQWGSMLQTRHGVSRLPARGRRFRLSHILSVAAAVALLSLLALPIYQLLSPASATELAGRYLREAPFPNHLVRKDVQLSIPEVRIRATEAYNLGHYTEAITYYQQLVAAAEARVDDFLYLGLGELYTDQSQAAVAHLEMARQKAREAGRFEQEANWFLGLAYLQNGQTERARPILENIVEQGHWKEEQAETLLSRMD